MMANVFLNVQLFQQPNPEIKLLWLPKTENNSYNNLLSSGIKIGREINEKKKRSLEWFLDQNKNITLGTGIRKAKIIIKSENYS